MLNLINFQYREWVRATLHYNGDTESVSTAICYIQCNNIVTVLNAAANARVSRHKKELLQILVERGNESEGRIHRV